MKVVKSGDGMFIDRHNNIARAESPQARVQRFRIITEFHVHAKPSLSPP